MECIRRSEAVIARQYILYIDHVQGDPFASPSRLHFEVKRDQAWVSRRILPGKASPLSLRRSGVAEIFI